MAGLVHTHGCERGAVVSSPYTRLSMGLGLLPVWRLSSKNEYSERQEMEVARPKFLPITDTMSLLSYLTSQSNPTAHLGSWGWRNQDKRTVQKSTEDAVLPW